MNNIITTTNTVATDTTDLISKIQNREHAIHTKRIEMIKLWIDQGNDLLKLQTEQGCSQNALSEITEISRRAVQNYIHLSKDKRLSEYLQQGGYRGSQLEDFTQKQLVSLTKLDDDAFEVSIQEGKIINTYKKEKLDKDTNSLPESDSDEIIDVEVTGESPAEPKQEPLIPFLEYLLRNPYERGVSTDRPQVSVDVDDATKGLLIRLSSQLKLPKYEVVIKSLLFLERSLDDIPDIPLQKDKK